MTRAEMEERNWDEVDIVFVTGDAYVDHPSFAAAMIGRVLEAAGFRVAILAQPNWHSCEAWKTFGRPKLAFCVSAGNMDSMISNYTANRKVRNDDAYSPNGQSGRRPDRATLAYCQRAREAYSGVTVITGGVEASLRRMAHYDFWSDKVKRSILMDSKADLLVYGMGESTILEVISRLAQQAAEKSVGEIRDIRGTVYRLGASEDLPEEDETTVHLPSCEEVQDDKNLFCEMTKIAHRNLNPYRAARLVQEHDKEAIVINPPSIPLSEAEMDAIYSLPFMKAVHPFYGDATIPAFEVVKTSIQIHRGCFGGCSFCSLAAHQGKFIQSRSKQSIFDEVEQLNDKKDYAGVVSDLGGPTANMYKLGGQNESQCRVCRNTSCLHPSICENLETDHGELLALMRSVRKTTGVREVFIASGVRTDLALLSPEYVEELLCHHVGGHLKTAPEHVDDNVLDLMQKPGIENYDSFVELFEEICREHQKDQYLVPYLIAGLPGSDIPAMIKVAEYLHKRHICPQQVQDFIPGPFELASCMYYTGKDPMTEKPVHVAKGMRERRMQRALLQYFKPENYYDVKMALRDCGREDLIGNGPDCLIARHPSRELAMTQSSRVKRLARKTAREKADRTAFREQKQQEVQNRKNQDRKKLEQKKLEQKKLDREIQGCKRQKPPTPLRGERRREADRQNDRFRENDRENDRSRDGNHRDERFRSNDRPKNVRSRPNNDRFRENDRENNRSRDRNHRDERFRPNDRPKNARSRPNNDRFRENDRENDRPRDGNHRDERFRSNDRPKNTENRSKNVKKWSKTTKKHPFKKRPESDR